MKSSRTQSAEAHSSILTLEKTILKAFRKSIKTDSPAIENQFRSYPQLSAWYAREFVTLKNDSKEKIKRIKIKDLIEDFEAAIANKHVGLALIIWENNKLLRDYYFGKSVPLGADNQSFSIDFRILNQHFMQLIELGLTDIYETIWQKNIDFQSWYMGKPVTMDGNVIHISDEKLIEILKFVLTVPSTLLHIGFWRKNQRLKNYVRTQLNREEKEDESAELLATVLLSKVYFKEKYLRLVTNINVIDKCLAYLTAACGTSPEKLQKWKTLLERRRTELESAVNIVTLENNQPANTTIVTTPMELESEIVSTEQMDILSLPDNTNKRDAQPSGLKKLKKRQSQLAESNKPQETPLLDPEILEALVRLIRKGCNNATRLKEIKEYFIIYPNLKLYFCSKQINFGSKEQPDIRSIDFSTLCTDFLHLLKQRISNKIINSIFSSNPKLQEWFVGLAMVDEEPNQSLEIEEIFSHFKLAMNARAYEIIYQFLDRGGPLKNYIREYQGSTDFKILAILQQILAPNISDALTKEFLQLLTNPELLEKALPDNNNDEDEQLSGSKKPKKRKSQPAESNTPGKRKNQKIELLQKRIAELKNLQQTTSTSPDIVTQPEHTSSAGIIFAEPTFDDDQTAKEPSSTLASSVPQVTLSLAPAVAGANQENDNEGPNQDNFAWGPMLLDDEDAHEQNASRFLKQLQLAFENPEVHDQTNLQDDVTSTTSQESVPLLPLEVYNNAISVIRGSFDKNRPSKEINNFFTQYPELLLYFCSKQVNFGSEEQPDIRSIDFSILCDDFIFLLKKQIAHEIIDSIWVSNLKLQEWLLGIDGKQCQILEIEKIISHFKIALSAKAVKILRKFLDVCEPLKNYIKEHQNSSDDLASIDLLKRIITAKTALTNEFLQWFTNSELIQKAIEYQNQPRTKKLSKNQSEKVDEEDNQASGSQHAGKRKRRKKYPEQVKNQKLQLLNDRLAQLQSQQVIPSTTDNYPAQPEDTNPLLGLNPNVEDIDIPSRDLSSDGLIFSEATFSFNQTESNQGRKVNSPTLFNHPFQPLIDSHPFPDLAKPIDEQPEVSATIPFKAP